MLNPLPANKKIRQDRSFVVKETPANNKIIATVLFSFLSTFVLARLVVYFVIGKLIPNLFLTIRGVHIHHFTYGVLILAVTELYLILKRPTPELPLFKLTTILYGIGLALTFDEFGMWIRLQDDYWIRQSYDAVIIVTVLLLNIRYSRWIIRALKEIQTHIKQLFRLI
jgi:hypothetical protein